MKENFFLIMMEKSKKSVFLPPNSASGSSSVGRAQPCQGWGREFESRFPLFRRDVTCNVSIFFKQNFLCFSLKDSVKRDVLLRIPTMSPLTFLDRFPRCIPPSPRGSISLLAASDATSAGGCPPPISVGCVP